MKSCTDPINLNISQ